MTRPEGSTPVFVDATGRRRRQWRRIAYTVGATCLTYTGLVAASVVGHPARPDALAPLPEPADRPLPAVRQTRPPDRSLTGVPLPSGDRPTLEAIPARGQRREPDEPSPPRPPRTPATPRIESTPLPTPTTAPSAPTGPPSPPEQADPPEPAPTDPPAPDPTGPPPPEPTPESPAEEPPAGLPVVGPILGLPSGGSAQR